MLTTLQPKALPMAVLSPIVPMAHSTLLRMQADAEQAAHAAGALRKGCTDWCWRKESESPVDFQKGTFDASNYFYFFKAAPFFFF